MAFKSFFCAQEPLIMYKNGIRIGFLGYCDHQTGYHSKNCSEMRSLFNIGPAVYQDAIATRDVKKLKRVCLYKILKKREWAILKVNVNVLFKDGINYKA